MRGRHRYSWALLVIATPAVANPVAHAQSIRAGETVAAAAMRVAAPFGTVTSTFRTVEHNRAVGGVPDSYHLFGQAIDIVRRHGVSHAQIAAALTGAGFHLIESLDERDHSHFAFGPRLHQTILPIQPSPQATPKIDLAADHHGTLRLDLGDASRGSGARSRASGGGRRAVH